MPHETSPPVVWKKNRKEKENEAFMGADHVLKLLAASRWLQCEPSLHPAGVLYAGLAGVQAALKGIAVRLQGSCMAGSPVQQERAAFTCSLGVWPWQRAGMEGVCRDQGQGGLQVIPEGSRAAPALLLLLRTAGSGAAPRAASPFATARAAVEGFGGAAGEE